MFEIIFVAVCVGFLNVLEHFNGPILYSFVIPRFVLCPEGEKHLHLG